MLRSLINDIGDSLELHLSYCFLNNRIDNCSPWGGGRLSNFTLMCPWHIHWGLQTFLDAPNSETDAPETPAVGYPVQNFDQRASHATESQQY